MDERQEAWRNRREENCEIAEIGGSCEIQGANLSTLALRPTPLIRRLFPERASTFGGDTFSHKGRRWSVASPLL
jgi:hypothetical protein